ncbi:MAG: type II secretion system protein GspD, partial [Terriglobia bacterium]
LTAVKQLMTGGGLQIMPAYEDPETNSITLYDTPERVAEAVQLIHNLDRGKAEVLIDVAVIEADRDRVRDLGLTTVPLSASAGTQAALGLNPSLAPTTTTNGTTTSTGTPFVPLNKLGKLSTSEFAVTLPGVVANALMTDSRTHILQNPEVRAEAGQEATLTIGQTIPFATGSFGIPTATGGTSAGGFGILANTQFNQEDVGVKLKITPWVAANGDVVLKSDIEISSLGGNSLIGGIAEPIINKRAVTHTIRVREGESSLLGGLIQTQTQNSVSGLPGLGRIPVLRYFFSTTDVETHDSDVMILLTPHVIRLPDAAFSDNSASPAPQIPEAPPTVAPKSPGVQP